MDAKVTITIPYLGITTPENISVNVWSFTMQDNEPSDIAEVGNYLRVWYQTMLPAMSPILNARDVRWSMYNRADPEPQVPFASGTFDLGDDTEGAAMPEESAICLSFKAQYASGTPNARRRGRIYFGPLNTTTVDVGDGRCLVNDTTISLMITATTEAEAELVTVGNNHAIWSQMDSTGRNVESYWIDNAFDTQRRRGPRATTRQPFTV